MAGPQEYWNKVRAGEIEHNTKPRGKDTKPRASIARLAFEAKLKQFYKLDINDVIVRQHSAVETLYSRAEAADKAGETKRADNLLDMASMRGNQLLTTLLPYTTPKRGTVNENLDSDDLIDADDLFTGELAQLIEDTRNEDS